MAGHGGLIWVRWLGFFKFWEEQRRRRERVGGWWLGTGFLSFNMAGHLYDVSVCSYMTLFQGWVKASKKSPKYKLSTFLNGLGSCLLRAFGLGLKPITCFTKKKEGPKPLFPITLLHKMDSMPSGPSLIHRLRHTVHKDLLHEMSFRAYILSIYYTYWTFWPTIIDYWDWVLWPMSSPFLTIGFSFE